MDLHLCRARNAQRVQEVDICILAVNYHFPGKFPRGRLLHARYLLVVLLFSLFVVPISISQVVPKMVTLPHHTGK